MELKTHEIHVWSVPLSITEKEEKDQFALLNADEQARALRFHFPKHRRRFIAGRSALRRILALYLEESLQSIQFSYDQHKKPFLSNPSLVQFNLAHSHEMAIYGITLNHAIGVDIEKRESAYPERVALRYFSDVENQQIQAVPADIKAVYFYRLWTRKEALVKAIGTGLSIPLSSFSLSANASIETLSFVNQIWTVLPLFVHDEYEAALASSQLIKKIIYWNFFDQMPKQTSIVTF